VAPAIIAVPVIAAISFAGSPVLKFSDKRRNSQMEKKKRARGSGAIFQNGSSVWWIKFYSNGIARRESSRSTDRKGAEKLLRRRLAEVETKTYAPRENVRTDELVADLFSDYRIHSRKSVDDEERRWNLHLQPFFTRVRAGDLTTDRIRAYIARRQDEGTENATINRELALLKRAFNLGLE
jgi:hypothetical protein